MLVDLLQRPQGADVHDLADAVGWQLHSVRGALAGALKSRGFVVTSEKASQLRIYRIARPANASRKPEVPGGKADPVAPVIKAGSMAKRRP